MDRLKGKTAIVTGAASGIGKSIATLFVEEGATIMAVDVNRELLEQTAVELNGSRMGSCKTMICDVTNPEQVNAVITESWNVFQTVDIIVNNAGGSMNHPLSLLDVTEEIWDRVVTFNLKSAYLFCRAFIAKHIEKGTKGVIVNLASTAGIAPDISMRPAYASAKGGVITLTKHIAQEFGPKGFRANCVCPGFIISGDRIRELWKLRDEDAILSCVALRRTAEPVEVANAVLFLASDEASYITGEALSVTGGKR